MWHDGDLSLSYLTVDGASAIQHVEAAAAGGFGAAGLRILPPSHLHAAEAVVGDAQAIRRLRQACRRLGVTPLDAEVLTLGPRSNRGDVVAMVAAAAELGFRFVQTVVEDTDPARAADNLALLAEEADRADLGIALEFMVFRPLRSLDAALALMDRSGAGNVGVMIDALHLARSGAGPDAVAAIPAERIAMAQLCDAPLAAPAGDRLATEARSRRLHPGEGELRLHELLDALPDGVALGLEVPHPSFPDLTFDERARAAKAELDAFLQSRAGRGNAGGAATANEFGPASKRNPVSSGA